jgi:hypothetical protein
MQAMNPVIIQDPFSDLNKQKPTKISVGNQRIFAEILYRIDEDYLQIPESTPLNLEVVHNHMQNGFAVVCSRYLVSGITLRKYDRVQYVSSLGPMLCGMQGGYHIGPP